MVDVVVLAIELLDDSGELIVVMVHIFPLSGFFIAFVNVLDARGFASLIGDKVFVLFELWNTLKIKKLSCEYFWLTAITY